jgi:hypothetical protein
MTKWIKPFFERLFSICLALVFLQAPAFMNQYYLILKGHVQELFIQIMKLTDIAGFHQKTLQEYILKFSQSGDPEFKSQGLFLEQLVERYTNLNQALTSLENASIVEKPIIFLKNMDILLVKETWQNFSFTLSFDLQGFVYLLMGFFIGLAIFHLIVKLFTRKKTDARQIS